MNRRTFIRNAAFLAVAAPLTPAIASTFPFRFQRDDDPDTFTGLKVFDRLLKLAEERRWKELPMGQVVGEVALELQGTPYAGSTLELYDDREVCSVNLLGLDCVTLFESALGFARMLMKGESTPEALLREVTFTRYRDGQLTDYTSRLHYTSEWFENNDEKGTVKVFTEGLPGAERFRHPIDFMSTHPESYRQLKANPSMVPVIAAIERKLNAREIYYVPKAKVAAIEPMLQTGDIVGVTTSIKGIDCSHTGLCYRDQDGKLRFLHASTTHKKVLLDVELHEYLASVSRHTGAMFARPLDCRLGGRRKGRDMDDR